MNVVVITLTLLAIFNLWQPNFLSSLSFSKIFLTEPIPGKVNQNGIISLKRPQLITTSSPSIKAAAAGVYDTSSHTRLWSNQDTEVRSIASLTKLMSALVFLDHNPGWEKIQKIEASDEREGGKANLFLGEELTTNDIFQTALIASDNTAITALVRSTGLSEAEFVIEMNTKAELYRFKNTTFVEPTGLDKANQSTVKEVAILAEKAFARTEIKTALLRNSYDFTTLTGREKHITSTNDLLRLPPIPSIAILAGKTGHLTEAGFCFVGWFEKNGHEIITVVLGTDDTAARFTETEKLVAWAYSSYHWTN